VQNHYMRHMLQRLDSKKSVGPFIDQCTRLIDYSNNLGMAACKHMTRVHLLLNDDAAYDRFKNFMGALHCMAHSDSIQLPVRG
jgi:hypothetical protein